MEQETEKYKFQLGRFKMGIRKILLTKGWCCHGTGYTGTLWNLRARQSHGWPDLVLAIILLGAGIGAQRPGPFQPTLWFYHSSVFWVWFEVFCLFFISLGAFGWLWALRNPLPHSALELPWLHISAHFNSLENWPQNETKSFSAHWLSLCL